MPPYQSLYRKHRPQAFSQLVGQGHVTTALRNAVKDGRVGHAYLFSGPRGTGKTTTARILAKALNCLDLGSDGEPCGKCENCVAIAEGRFLDLFELDAASNNSVDNIRDLTESVNLGLGPSSTRKIYIVDEVHMLSAAASNALLKTLEEPPDHVVFVLATTNPEKVLPTIRSRAQHFEFTLLTADELQAHIAQVARAEGVEADRDALATIARVAGGSARDALSLLDQALAHGTGRLDAAPVADLFGGTPFDARCRVLEAVAAEDAPGVLIAVGKLLEAGHEPRRIAEDLLRASRDGFLLVAGAGRVGLDATDEEQQRLSELGRSLGNATLVHVLETLGQAIVDMRGTDAADPRLVLEIALVRLTRREAGPLLQTVVERIERLERAIADRGGDPPLTPPATPRPGRTLGGLRRDVALRAPNSPEPVAAQPEAAAVPAAETPAAPAAAEPGPAAEAVPEPSPPKTSGPLEVDDVILAWGQVLPALPVATRSAVQEAQPVSVTGDVITFAVPPRLFEAARPRFRRERETIRAALTERLGRTVRFNLVAGDPLGTATQAHDRGERAERIDEIDLVDDHPVDPGELADAAPALAEGLDLLADGLGATVVEEHPRD
jgi:DNA polymerase-3 subunit gamma/tau